MFISAFTVEGAVRADYDAARTPVSLLLLGTSSPLMAAAFVVAGLLTLWFAAAVRADVRAGPSSRWGWRAIGMVGLGLVVAGVFPPDPSFGYPPGAPAGIGTSVSPSAILHVGGAALLQVGLVDGPLIFARQRRRDGWTVAAGLALASAVTVLAGYGAASGGPDGPFLPSITGLAQRVALVAGLGWIAAVAISTRQGK